MIGYALWLFSLTAHRRIAGTEASGRVEEKLTSGRENRLKSRGLSSAIGRARAGGKRGGKETAEDRASESSSMPIKDDHQSAPASALPFVYIQLSAP